MTPSWVTYSLFYYYLGINSQKWEWASSMNTLWLSICDAKSLFTRIVPISTGPEDVWGRQFPLPLLWWHRTSTLECPGHGHVYDCAFHHNPVYEADLSLSHLFCEMMCQCVTFIFWDNKHLFGSLLYLIEPVHEWAHNLSFWMQMRFKRWA